MYSESSYLVNCCLQRRSLGAGLDPKLRLAMRPLLEQQLEEGSRTRPFSLLQMILFIC
jgi:hypothetical protein